jgi:hypothetical protein
MKITEVRKIYNQNPNTIWAVVSPESHAYPNQIESKEVEPNACLRVRIVSLDKYATQYNTRYKSLADAQIRARKLNDSDKSFGVLCQVIDDQHKPTGELVVIPSRNSWIGELTPEIESWWADESIRQTAMAAERDRRAAIQQSVAKQASQRGDEIRAAIMKSTIAVLATDGLKVPMIKVDVSGRIVDWGNHYDLDSPYDETKVKSVVSGEVSMEYGDFQRLLEIVYASKERLDA